MREARREVKEMRREDLEHLYLLIASRKLTLKQTLIDARSHQSLTKVID